MKEIPPEVFAALEKDFVPLAGGPHNPEPEDIGLNQFENLVIQKIKDFGNCYGNLFCDVWPDTYPDFISVEDWMDLFKLYLTAEDKHDAIRMWGSIRNTLKEVD
jgi:hypothetical protein